MLSYRHAYHAGNPADVLKHHVLIEVLQHLNQKEKPWRFIDTHAGAGGYALDSATHIENKEAQDGIGRLWPCVYPCTEEKAASPLAPAALPAGLKRYLDQIHLFNPDGRLTFYPGSPALARSSARPSDELRFFERHPTDLRALEALFSGQARVQVLHKDGFEGFTAFWPPHKGRAVLFMDPSYEQDSDYAHAFDAVVHAHTRFPSGIIVLWYPLLARATVRRLETRLQRVQAPAWLHARLLLKTPPRSGVGLYGSGLFIIHPPWSLKATLQESLPWLAAQLGEDEKAGFTLDAHLP